MTTKETLVLFQTSMGDFTVRLYDETPLHRDNFVKLVQEGFYSDLLFHRVIQNFMIQAGDPKSKNAPAGKNLGSGDVGYTIPAEFVYPRYFHKKGALSAARLGDQGNPQKESSGCQFYIVTGEIQTKEHLAKTEKSLGSNRENKVFNQLAQLQIENIRAMQAKGDQQGLYSLQDELTKKAKEQVKLMPPASFTAEQIEAYSTIGGTPFLDEEYTVFGEVVAGMEVIDAIKCVKTVASDRPVEDVKIIKVTLL